MMYYYPSVKCHTICEDASTITNDDVRSIITYLTVLIDTFIASEV